MQNNNKGIDPQKVEEYTRRIGILLLKGEFLPAWFTIAEAHQTLHHQPHKEPLKTRHLSESNLNTKTLNGLAKNGILTWGQLSTKTEQELLKIKNFGPATIEEIKQELKKQIDL